MTDDMLSKEVELLLLGWGFNFYRVESQMRADDLLIRQKAGESLGQAAAKLEKLANEFQRTCIPAPSRENPYPPAKLMDQLRSLRELRQRVLNMESFLQGMPAPAQDKIWRRLRDEQSLLQSLLQADVLMIQAATEIEKPAQTLTAEGWKSPDASAVLVAAMDKWDAMAHARQQLLQIPAIR